MVPKPTFYLIYFKVWAQRIAVTCNKWELYFPLLLIICGGGQSLQPLINILVLLFIGGLPYGREKT